MCLVAIDECMVALKWTDKHQVPMLSTVPNDSMITKARRTRQAEGGHEEVRKPVMVDKYMGVWTRATSSCTTMVFHTGW